MKKIITILDNACQDILSLLIISLSINNLNEIIIVYVYYKIFEIYKIRNVILKRLNKHELFKNLLLFHQQFYTSLQFLRNNFFSYLTNLYFT